MLARDLNFLIFARRYFFFRARQVQIRLVPGDDDCSITRSILRRLVALGYIRKHQPKMIDTLSGSNSAAPIYVLTMTGASILAAETDDASFFLAGDTSFGQWLSLSHYTALTSLHMMIDDAFAAQTYVKQTALHFEHEVAKPDAKDGSKYLLHFQLSKTGEKPLFCIPDSMIETEIKGVRRAWATEFETGSDTVTRVFAKKHKGYEGLVEKTMWKRVLPNAGSFRVVCFCPSPNWMHALRKEFSGKKLETQWIFCPTPAVNAKTFLHEPIFWTVEKGPFPLIPRPT